MFYLYTVSESQCLHFILGFLWSGVWKCLLSLVTAEYEALHIWWIVSVDCAVSCYMSLVRAKKSLAYGTMNIWVGSEELRQIINPRFLSFFLYFIFFKSKHYMVALLSFPPSKDSSLLNLVWNNVIETWHCTSLFIMLDSFSLLEVCIRHFYWFVSPFSFKCWCLQSKSGFCSSNSISNLKLHYSTFPDFISVF